VAPKKQPAAPKPPDTAHSQKSADVSRNQPTPIPTWLQSVGNVVDMVFGITATDAAIDRITRGDGTPDDYLRLALGVGSIQDDPLANVGDDSVARIADRLTFGKHATDTMAKRGWSQAMVRELVDNPHRVVSDLRDTRYNEATQTRNDFAPRHTWTTRATTWWCETSMVISSKSTTATILTGSGHSN